MAWTQADIDTLKAHLASGILIVQYVDRSVTYKSNEDMLMALAMMEKEVNPTSSPNYRLAQTSKGV